MYFPDTISRTAAANVLDITYGIHIDEKIGENGDDYVMLATSAILPFSHAGIFGTYMVVRPHIRPTIDIHMRAFQDYIPALKYLPLWCAPFKRKAKEWRKAAQALVNRPFEVVQTKMVGKFT